MLFSLLGPLFISAAVSLTPLDSLRESLAAPTWSLTTVAQSPFATQPLTKAQAAEASKLLCDALTTRLRTDRQKDWTAKEISLGDKTMKFDFNVFGDAPPTGRALFISMHGGGSTTSKVNDQQWRNQIRLYTPAEGVYLAPRAPTDAWNMWHQEHVDPMFDRIIEDAILFENVNPNRVYLMGYSAGGDGVYQLAPRMADRFAAASMMAGHPNEASPLGLRNLPFAIHVGEKDAAFNRNSIAKEWETKLDELAKADPKGYTHHVEVHPGKPHWMDREDASAVPWMAAYTRDPLPYRIVWRQDDVIQHRFYWLAADGTPKAGDLLDITLDNNEFIVSPESTVTSFWILLSDALLPLDNQPITVKFKDTAIKLDPPIRTISHICTSLQERFDPQACFTSRVQVQLSAPKPKSPK